MGKVYKLLPETAKQLSNVEGVARNITLIFCVSLLILHLFITASHYLIGYFFPFIFFPTSLGLLAILVYSYFRGENHFYNYYSSYQIEISDQSITFMQMNKSPIEIRHDEIMRIQEITPEGEIYVVGTRNRKFIDIYALLLRENPEIREQLTAWKPLDKRSVTTQKIAGPILVVLCGIMASYCFLRGFIYSDFIVPGFVLFGGSIIGFFKIRRWPVYDPRIRNLLWVVIGLAIISAVLALIDLLFLVYTVIGMYLGLF